jgi:thiamine phosphate synthase YjbQ (UPF0047 family)
MCIRVLLYKLERGSVVRQYLPFFVLTIPITNGHLNMGTWQGIYLCEFRNHGGPRRLVVTIIGA